MSVSQLNSPLGKEWLSRSLCVAFIDPIVSTLYLTEELHKKKVKIIAVFTLMQLSEEQKRLRFHPELFDHVIYVDDNMSVVAVAEELKKLQAQYVFYGYEASVAFADQVSYLVCSSYANDPNTSQLRIDKYEMQESLRKISAPHVKQIKIANRLLSPAQISELQQWNYPVMVKPNFGVGSIGVKKCYSLNEVEVFIKESRQLLLHAAEIHEFIVQEYLVGDEYFVDTFSLLGEHKIASVQRYKKISYQGCPIYRYIETLDPNSIEWKMCGEYVLRTLDVIGMKNGFAHTELFLTANGPFLIEVNPRISGISGFSNKLSQITLHCSQPQLLCNTLNSLPDELPTKLWSYGITVCLQNWQPREITELNVKLLQSLPSYRENLMLKSAGSYLDAPKTLLDTVGVVLLVNADKEKLFQDFDRLCEWESNKQLF